VIYLDNAASTPCLKSVMTAMHDANREWSNVHRGLHPYAEATTKRYEAARCQVADFIQADPEEIVFTSGTTDSLNMVARGLIGHGDNIVVTEMDHHSNIVPWQSVAWEKGGSIKIVPVQGGMLDLDYLEAVLQSRPKILALPAVSNVLGTINPVAKIARMAREKGVITVVDAAQSVPHIQHCVHNMDVDFLAFSGHKMHGPTGIGVLYARKDRINDLTPSRYGGGMVIDVMKDDHLLKKGYQKLEAGTPPIQQAIGLGEACRHWADIGMEAVCQHTRVLTWEAHRRLAAHPGVHVLGPAPHQGSGIIGIVSFTVDGIHAHDVAALLGERNIAIRAGHHCALPLHRALGITASARVSFSYFNGRHEIDFFMDALTDIQETFTPSGSILAPDAGKKVQYKI
jgi:cysteine desulfurase/selenocysteine lyase